ncbi:MAG: methionine adenosyltransferase [Candidatus Curtissbacteria bacterium]|nr:methionine adenosyltransferase [Candidatus Curtissbacteria bacterium]
MAAFSTFTSESVCAGHPDKICDQISDAILDEVLRQDPCGRVAVETVVAKNRIIIVGELTAAAEVDITKIAKEQIRRLGYTKPQYKFSDKSPIEVYVSGQSVEISKGVDSDGAGDQGMMFGYASNETKSLMPLPITIAHALARRIDEVRESKILPYLRPDGKSQVTCQYKNGKPYGVSTVVLAVPHEERVELIQVRNDLCKHVISEVLAQFGFKIGRSKVIVNGTGVWHLGGPASDSGVTGRKIVVDTYGGYARVGGGCFSGKDPTKVDRSGAYAARYIAKNIVAHGLAKRAEVRLAYFIGATKPIMQEVETFGTARMAPKAINDFASKVINTSVKGIIEELDLRRPIYLKTAAYGHFGRDEFPWEKIKEI